MRTARVSRPTVLLTGFGPFRNVRRNASATLVRRLAREARLALPHCRFAAAVLPTEWVRAPSLLSELYERHDPALALHFGVASNIRGFRIETEARNFCRMSTDAAGSLPVSGCLCESGAPELAATVSVADIARHLEAQGFEAKLSHDAGGYLCNAVFYRSLVEARVHGNRCKVGFVHIPVDSGTPEDAGRIASGALEILKFALQPSASHVALTSV